MAPKPRGARLAADITSTQHGMHPTTHVTPAMAVGVADHPREVEEIVGRLKEEAVVILR
jgi:hypothetical protein